jgi:hypothetical protein
MILGAKKRAPTCFVEASNTADQWIAESIVW